MSYTLGVWSAKADDDMEQEAIQEVFELAWESDAEPAPLLLSLVDTLLQKFPEEPEEQMVWDSSPLSECVKGTTFYPGVRLSLDDETFGNVCETFLTEAHKLALSVIDWQSGEIFAPQEKEL